MKKLKYAFTGVLLYSVSLATNAELIYDFDISDTSWSTGVYGDFTDASIFIKFADSTDYNSVQKSDLLSIGFSNVFGTYEFTNDEIRGDKFSNLFSSIGNSVYIHYGYGQQTGHLGASHGFYAPTPNIGFSIHANHTIALTLSDGAGNYMYMNNHPSDAQPAAIKGSQRVNVPEPSSLAIFALGIMGLVIRRFKKQLS